MNSAFILLHLRLCLPLAQADIPQVVSRRSPAGPREEAHQALGAHGPHSSDLTLHPGAEAARANSQ